MKKKKGHKLGIQCNTPPLTRKQKRDMSICFDAPTQKELQEWLRINHNNKVDKIRLFGFKSYKDYCEKALQEALKIIK